MSQRSAPTATGGTSSSDTTHATPDSTNPCANRRAISRMTSLPAVVTRIRIMDDCRAADRVEYVDYADADRVSLSGVTGRLTTNVVPSPSVESTVIVPRMPLTHSATIARPRPTPSLPSSASRDAWPR